MVLRLYYSSAQIVVNEGGQLELVSRQRGNFVQEATPPDRVKGLLYVSGGHNCQEFLLRVVLNCVAEQRRWGDEWSVPSESQIGDQLGRCDALKSRGSAVLLSFRIVCPGCSEVRWGDSCTGLWAL